MGPGPKSPAEVWQGPPLVSFNSAFLVALALAFASLLLIGLMEMLPDGRLAVLAIGAMALACGIVCCTAIKV